MVGIVDSWFYWSWVLGARTPGDLEGGEEIY